MSVKDFELFNAPTSPYPLKIEVSRAEGAYIYDKENKPYLDAISGIGVSNIGHQHPKVKEALKNQIDRHLHVMVYGEMVQESQTEFAKNICDYLPENLNQVYLVNSGAEAVEAALKLAKRVTGRSKLMSFQGAYHGNTHGAMSVSYNEYKKAPFRPLLPGVSFLKLNDFEGLNKINKEYAAVILETVQGDAGVRIPDPRYLQALRSKCNEHQVCLIFDEIQCGMGRTGKLFAFEHFDVVPDILVLGKALGGGLPIGAVVADRKLLQQFSFDPPLGHITTFGGHPLPAASGNAALKVLTEEIDFNQVNAWGKELKECLIQHKNVIDIRQIGYYIAVDLKHADEVQTLIEHCLSKGVLLFWFLSCPWSFRIAPPLNLKRNEFDFLLKTILEGLDKW